jgi:hypothetical protein
MHVVQDWSVRHFPCCNASLKDACHQEACEHGEQEIREHKIKEACEHSDQEALPIKANEIREARSHELQAREACEHGDQEALPIKANDISGQEARSHQEAREAHDQEIRDHEIK